MQIREDENHLLDYWQVVLKRRQIVLIFFAVIVGIVGVYSFAASPVYRGTAQVLIELEKNPVMTFAEGVGAYIQMKDSAEYYRTQMEILKSRSFGDRVVKKLQLDKNAYFLDRKEKRISLFRKVKSAVFSIFPQRVKPDNPFGSVLIQEEVDKDLTDEVLEHMEIELGRGNDILKIHYDSKNPLVAATMANGIANAYIEHNLDIRVKPFRDAVEWLSARLVESKSKVEDSQKVLQKYKEGQGIVSFETKENVITQKLQEIMSQLVQAETKRQESEVRYNQIKSVIEKPELLATVPDIMNNPVIQALRTDELAAKKKISELSDKFGPKHPQMISARTDLEAVQKSLIAEARKMLNAAKTDYDISRGRELSLRLAIEDQKQEVLKLSRKAIDFDVYAGEADSNKQFYELLLKKLQEASLSSGINVSNAQVVDGASVPDDPIRPTKTLNLFLAAIIGLLGGVFAAFFADYMDNTIKTPDEVEKLLHLPFLGYVPATNIEEGPIYMFSGAKANVAESYRTIRTSIMLSTTEENRSKVVVVTSATPNEGKTTTASNLAVAMAQMGERVLLVDTDMRRHNLHRVFGVDNLIGISDAIVDRANIPAAIQSLSHIPNLDVITGGTLAPNPSELLGSNSMKELILELRTRYDRVILDSPPLMLFSDALVLSRLADGVVLVLWGGVTARETVRKAGQSVLGVNKVLGVVLNNLSLEKMSSSYYYSYYPYYGYYYNQEKTGKKNGKKQKKA